MTALSGGARNIVGSVIDNLFSASYTMTFGYFALQGLSQVAVVAKRGFNGGLKLFGFDTSKTGSFAKTATTLLPVTITTFFKDGGGYNKTYKTGKNVPVLDDKGEAVMENGQPKMEQEKKTGYVYGTVALLVRGLALSIFGLFMLQLKESFWRPADPLLNRVLSYISPFQVELGKSWIADGFNHLAGAAKARL